MAFMLVIVAGPSAGQRIPLGQAGVTVGRQTGNSLVVNDQQLSRQHAQFTLSPSGPAVTDLDSANGTRINGQPIVGTRPLQAGDLIQFGATTIRIEADSTSAPIGAIAPQPAFGAPYTPPLAAPQPARSGSSVPLILGIIAGVFLLLCVCGGGTLAFVASRSADSTTSGTGAPSSGNIGSGRASGPTTTISGNTSSGTSGGSAVGGGGPAASVAPGGRNTGGGASSAGLPLGDYKCSMRSTTYILEEGWIHIISATQYQWSDDGTRKANSTRYTYTYNPTTHIVVFSDGPFSDGREKEYVEAEDYIRVGFAGQCPRRS